MPLFSSGIDSGRRRFNSQLSLMNSHLAAIESLTGSLSESERSYEINLRALISMLEDLYKNLDNTFFETIGDMQSVASVFLYLVLAQVTRMRKLDRDYVRETSIEYTQLLDDLGDILGRVSQGSLPL